MDHLEADIVAKLNQFAVALVAVAALLNLAQPVTIIDAQRMHNLGGQRAFGRELLEPR